MFRGDDEDKIIADQVISGQKELFRLLVKRHERAVYALGLSFFRNAEDSSDFTQDVFLKVFRSLQQFEGKARFSTWLYKVAYNTAINAVSRNTLKQDYQSLAEDNIASGAETPEQKVLRDLARDTVREAIAGLPERFRLCVDLFFFYDRSYREIEMITGYPANTVKSHVFRAKKILRKKLALCNISGKGETD